MPRRARGDRHSGGSFLVEPVAIAAVGRVRPHLNDIPLQRRYAISSTAIPEHHFALRHLSSEIRTKDVQLVDSLEKTQLSADPILLVASLLAMTKLFVEVSLRASEAISMRDIRCRRNSISLEFGPQMRGSVSLAEFARARSCARRAGILLGDVHLIHSSPTRLNATYAIGVSGMREGPRRWHWAGWGVGQEGSPKLSPKVCGAEHVPFSPVGGLLHTRATATPGSSALD